MSAPLDMLVIVGIGGFLIGVVSMFIGLRASHAEAMKDSAMRAITSDMDAMCAREGIYDRDNIITQLQGRLIAEIRMADIGRKTLAQREAARVKATEANVRRGAERKAAKAK